MVDFSAVTFVYIIKNEFNRYYTGITYDLKKRLGSHNSQKNISTKYAKNWQYVYYEPFETRRKAAKFERYIKNISASKFLSKNIWLKLNYQGS